jgi:glycosyltransferase involved in cell wall biosynthesis
MSSRHAPHDGLPMRLLIATDTWHPQVNGVVRSIEHMVRHAEQFGAAIALIEPGQFRSLPLPTYPEIRLGLARPSAIASRISEFKPTHIHITTEGPIGFASRWVCLRHRFPFSTSYHTRFPEYVSARVPVPERCVYWILRRFHNAAGAVLVATESLRHELAQRGFRNIRLWTRGVDPAVFHPHLRRSLDAKRPVSLYVGRLAVEKNLPAYLSLDLPGTKMVVGDGPARPALERAFPQARFLGTLEGEQLARAYASADLFVFPSRTDTFGMVLLEALASGLPIAAFPVTGPRDVLGDSGCGILDDDLQRAALKALDVPRARCRAFAEGFDWQESARQFFEGVQAANGRYNIDVAALRR